ncbi:HAD hydrolase-like protein [Christensenellaceae bacterium OttesenSCG-928-M15]|nr:HAD hydrolase-like protein [Christensenellaceae bacterium OttesenSCG-928-M15]
MKYKAFIFDFDGTLVDSVPGIVISIKALMEACGKEPLTDEQMRGCVGPPIHKFFPEILGFQEDELEEAIAQYRRIFDEVALPMLCAFDGVLDMLRALKERGAMVGIASCKVKHAAIRQAETLGIAQYVDVIGGAVPEEGIYEKTDVLNGVLSKLKVPLEEAVMIGDRKFDLIGAKEAGIDGIGVMYGGSTDRQELVEHSPIAIANSVEELKNILLGV